MPRPTGGKVAVKGTRSNDTITVNATGVTVNGNFRDYTSDQVAAGFLLKGDAGDDTITGGTGPDEIDGGSGNDRIEGGAGLDKLMGGAGNDVLVDLDVLLVDSNRTDTIDPNADIGATFDGGRGIDTIDFSGSTTAIAISLEGVIWADFHYDDTAIGFSRWENDMVNGVDRSILGVENLIGSSGDDVLLGNQYDNEIHGGDGRDYLNGGGTTPSDDRLFGDAGDDLLSGGTGNDLLTGGSGADDFVFEGRSGANTGHDVILDYEVDVDELIFHFTGQAPTWALGSYDGTPSLVGTYGDGYTVTVVGITSEAQLDYQVLAGTYT